MLVTNTNILAFKTSNLASPSDNNFFTGSFNTLKLDLDPLINGYSFFKWTVVPAWVTAAFPGFTELTEKNFKEGFSLGDIELDTLNITHGFNANEYYFAGGIKKQNTDFSIKHQEFSGSPMRNMYQYWVTGIRDPETGIATYPRLAGCDYAAKNHTGEIIYIVTRPDANNVDMNNIEFSCYYSAVFPTKIQLNQFAHSIGNHSETEYEQNFKGDFHMSPQVDAFAREVLKAKVYGFMELNDFDPTNPKKDSKYATIQAGNEASRETGVGTNIGSETGFTHIGGDASKFAEST